MNRDVSDSSTPARRRIGRLCEHGVRAAGVDGIGVSIILADGRPQPLHATDRLSAVVEELQFTLGEGPCFDATASRAPVLVGDLAAAQGRGRAARWPIFADEAIAAGVRAVFAFPLGLGSSSLGTLDMYRADPGPLAEGELADSLVMADAVGMAMLDGDSSTGPGPLDFSSLRMSVHRAAGMVMVQSGGTIETALLLLRASAYGEGRSINELATEVLEGRRRYDKEQG